MNVQPICNSEGLLRTARSDANRFRAKSLAQCNKTNILKGGRMSFLKQMVGIYVKNRMLIAGGVFLLLALSAVFIDEVNATLLLTLLFLAVGHLLAVVYYESFGTCSKK